MANWFSGNGFAWSVNAERCSISVRAVTAGSAIAASPAVIKPDSINAAAPTAVTRTARKDGGIIATVSGSIGNAGRKRA
jgi:hypothetical protein